MDEETNEISKILYTILIILICIVLGIYFGELLINLDMISKINNSNLFLI